MFACARETVAGTSTVAQRDRDMYVIKINKYIYIYIEMYIYIYTYVHQPPVVVRTPSLGAVLVDLYDGFSETQVDLR